MLEKEVFFLYIFLSKSPPKKKNLWWWSLDPSQKEQQNYLIWNYFDFCKKKKMKLKCQNEKIYQSNDDVTHYLSNEKTKHTTPAAVPKITSNFVPDCISSTGKEERRKNPWKRKKKRLFLMHKNHTPLYYIGLIMGASICACYSTLVCFLLLQCHPPPVIIISSDYLKKNHDHPFPHPPLYIFYEW